MIVTDFFGVFNIDDTTRTSLERYFLGVYKNIQVINIKYPILIYSDVHGNLPPIEMALKYSKSNNISKSISLGDMIDRHPYSNEVIDLIKKSKDLLIVLAGNHETAEKMEMKKIAFELNPNNKYQLSVENIDWIITWPELAVLEFNDKIILLTHSNPWNLTKIYLFEEFYGIKRYFLDYIPHDGFMLGHTHKVDFQKHNGSFLFNPGTLGNTRMDEEFFTFCWLLPNENEIHWYKIEHETNKELNLTSEEPEFYKKYNLN